MRPHLGLSERSWIDKRSLGALPTNQSMNSQGIHSNRRVHSSVHLMSSQARMETWGIWFQKLNCWGPVVRFPILSTSQTFLGLESESSGTDSPASTSSCELPPVALKLGRTPNVAQRALYRALIWRNNLGISTSTEGSKSEDAPEGEGLVRGNWAIVSSKTLILWIARLVQIKGSAYR